MDHLKRGMELARVARRLWRDSDRRMAVGEDGMTLLFGGKVVAGGCAFLWQEDGEDGAGSCIRDAGTHTDAAAMFFDELAGDPEAEAGAGIFFGGEEGFEDVADVVAVNAAAGVGDGDADAAARGVARVGGGVCFDADVGASGAGVE